MSASQRWFFGRDKGKAHKENESIPRRGAQLDSGNDETRRVGQKERQPIHCTTSELRGSRVQIESFLGEQHDQGFMKVEYFQSETTRCDEFLDD